MAENSNPAEKKEEPLDLPSGESQTSESDSVEPLEKEEKKDVNADLKNVKLNGDQNKSKQQIKGKIKKVVRLNEIQTKEKKEEEEDPLNFEDEDYSEEGLKKAMAEYAELLQSKNKPGDANLLRKEYDFEEGEIRIRIESSVDESRYNDVKSDLLLFLRKKLRNKSIKLGKNVIEQEKQKTIYTPQEKFDYLAEKNPALLELKKRLGLEFEF